MIEAVDDEQASLDNHDEKVTNLIDETTATCFTAKGSYFFVRLCRSFETIPEATGKDCRRESGW